MKYNVEVTPVYTGNDGQILKAIAQLRPVYNYLSTREDTQDDYEAVKRSILGMLEIVLRTDNGLPEFGITAHAVWDEMIDCGETAEYCIAYLCSYAARNLRWED